MSCFSVQDKAVQWHSELLLWPLRWWQQSFQRDQLVSSLSTKCFHKRFCARGFCLVGVAITTPADKEGGGAFPVESTEPRRQRRCSEGSSSLPAFSVMGLPARRAIAQGVSLRMLFPVDSFEESSNGCKWNQSGPVPS